MNVVFDCGRQLFIFRDSLLSSCKLYFFGGGFGLGTPVVSYAPLLPMLTDVLSEYEKRRIYRRQTEVYIGVPSET